MKYTCTVHAHVHIHVQYMYMYMYVYMYMYMYSTSTCTCTCCSLSGTSEPMDMMLKVVNAMEHLLEDQLYSAHFSLKRRESELSQLVLLCCFALFDASLICNHVMYMYMYMYMYKY